MSRTMTARRLLPGLALLACALPRPAAAQEDPYPCTEERLSRELFFIPYHLNIAREYDGWRRREGTAENDPYEEHYLNSAFGSGADLFVLDGLQDTEYAQWPFEGREREGGPYYHYGLMNELVTGWPVKYILGVHDYDSRAWGSTTTHTDCGNLIKVELAYDPDALELLALGQQTGSVTGVPGACRPIEPGLITCHFNDSAGSFHFSTKAHIYIRPLKAFAASGNPLQATLTVLREGLVVDGSAVIDSLRDVGARGDPAPRTAAQLAVGYWALAQDIEDTLLAVAREKHAAQGLAAVDEGGPHALFLERDVEIHAGLDDSAFIDRTLARALRFTRSGARFWTLTNEPRPDALPASPSEGGVFAGTYSAANGTWSSRVRYFEVSGRGISGWMYLHHSASDTTVDYFFFEAWLSNNPFVHAESDEALVCDADGKTVLLRSGGADRTVGTCENSCNAQGQCLMADGTPYDVFPPPTAGNELAPAECEPGEGRACGSALVRDLCLDRYWSGCPTPMCERPEASDWMVCQ